MKAPVSRKGERGFALLIVFLMAAAIALMLYQQMPRQAFESERDKEQLLIDRGEQYKRAIQLYMVANKRYPARIEDLENTNDKRFLRKRYIDPFTGKNEWRLIHTNGAALTDSLVQKPPAAPGDDKNKDTSTTASNTNPNGAAPAPDVNGTVLQRPSDRTLPTGAPGQFGGAQGDPNYPTPNPTNPSGVGIGPGQLAFPPITLSQIQATGQQQGVNGQGQPQQGQVAPGAVQPGGLPIQFPTPTGTGQMPGNPTQFQSGQFPPGAVQPGQIPGGTLPGGAPGPTNNAINLINNLLTQPRTPPAGIGGSPANNNTIGGGIAGVASTFEGPSIKAYNTRTKFNEWEFVFQPQQQGAPGQAGIPTNGQASPGQSGGSLTPTPGTASPPPAQ